METNQMLGNPKVKKSLTVLVSAVLVFLAYILFHFISVSIVMGKARTALDGGFPAVAVVELESSKQAVVKRKDGCKLLMDAYFASRRAEQLEWASQACLASGQESPEAYLALSISYELRGGDAEALRVLDAGTKKFEKIPALYMKIAQILARNKSFDEAGSFYNKAVEKGPDNQNNVMEAMQFFTQTGKGDLAKAMAAKIRSAKTDNPEVKMVIARAFKAGGDLDSAKALVSEAEGLVASDASAKARLLKAYEDVVSNKPVPRVPASKK